MNSSTDSSSSEDVHEPANSSDSPSAEEFAASLLGKWIEQADVLKLFDCLPQSAPQRGGGGGTSFATGAFAKVKVGLRGNVAVFPKTTEALAAFVRQSAPAHKFTTIVVFDSVLTTPHRDQQNSFLPNLAVPVSSFTQGSIWVQSDNGPHARMIDGAELRGVALPVSDGPVLFDARRSLRLTDAWSGRRVVLVAFSMSAIDKLSPDAAARLTALRFALPSPDDVEHFRRYPQLPARLPWPPRFPLRVTPSAEVPLQTPVTSATVEQPFLRSRCSLSCVPVRPCFLDVFARQACRSCQLIISITATTLWLRSAISASQRTRLGVSCVIWFGIMPSYSCMLLRPVALVRPHALSSARACARLR